MTNQLKGSVMIFCFVELHHVKGFSGTFRAEFSRDKSIFAISGANGSGKSTVLRSLCIVQKAFFALQLSPGTTYHTRYAEMVDDEVARHLRDSQAYIEVGLIIDNSDNVETIKLLRDTTKSQGWDLNSSNMEALKKLWDINHPTSIILYLDAAKAVLEEEVRYTKLDIQDSSSLDLSMRCIFAPQNAFSAMYRQIIQDYIVERLVPSTPPRIFYQRVARVVFRNLIGSIEIKNFSPRQDKQVSLLARRIPVDKSQSSFDIRELSSGEKTLFFTLSFLFLADTIGTLIIDEPENHFHEHLLLQFASFLGDLLQTTDLSKFLKPFLDSEYLDGTTVKDWTKTVRKVYSSQGLSQVFLLTHSKSLIYHAFRFGKNYAITRSGGNQTWSVLAEEDAEASLRQVGLSTTLSRVLFVEGKGDSILLEEILAERNVVVKPLDGGSAVQDMFKRLSQVRSHIKGATFAFLIDKDDKPAGYFQRLEAHDSDFYKSNFILLDRHELENYLLHESAIRTTFITERGNHTKYVVPSNKDIRSTLVTEARKALVASYKKAVNARIQMAAEALLAPMLWGNTKMDYAAQATLSGDLATAVPSTLADDVRKLATDIAAELRPRYYNITDEDALHRCDGKSVLNIVVAKYAKECGRSKSDFLDTLFAQSVRDNSTPVGKKVEQILAVFSGI